MSLQANTDLMELASENIMYWAGTPMEKVLLADLERDDLESLEEHLKESARLMFQNEYNPHEVGDEY